MTAITTAALSRDDALDPDTLAHLRWLTESPHAIAVVDKQVLRVLLDAYQRQRDAPVSAEAAQ